MYFLARSTGTDNPMNPKKVLVVDDALSVRIVIKKALEQEGHKVLEAGNGKDAIDLLQKSTQRVDFIISDFNMPVMDGAEFVQKVRALPDYRFIKVLMLTGNVNDQTKDQAKKAGVSAWMTKPFDIQAIVRAVQKLAA